MIFSLIDNGRLRDYAALPKEPRRLVEGPKVALFGRMRWQGPSQREPPERLDRTRAQAALEHLCRIYWYPIYHFVRRQGHSTHDAQDLTQEFFARLLARRIGLLK
jgi:RNA polymerase sigma-70 factor (ECF subfamily)